MSPCNQAQPHRITHSTTFAQHVASLRVSGSLSSCSSSSSSHVSNLTPAFTGPRTPRTSRSTSGGEKPPLARTADSARSDSRAGMQPSSGPLLHPAPSSRNAGTHVNSCPLPIPRPRAASVGSSAVPTTAQPPSPVPVTTGAVIAGSSAPLQQHRQSDTAAAYAAIDRQRGHSSCSSGHEASLTGRRAHGSTRPLDSNSLGVSSGPMIDQAALAALDAQRPGTSRSSRAAAAGGPGCLRPGTAICGVAAGDGLGNTGASAFIGSNLASWFSTSGASGVGVSPWFGARDESPAACMHNRMRISRSGPLESVEPLPAGYQSSSSMGALASSPVPPLPLQLLMSKADARGGLPNTSPRLPSLYGGTGSTGGGTAGANSAQTVHPGLKAQSLPGECTTAPTRALGRAGRPHTWGVL